MNSTKQLARRISEMVAELVQSLQRAYEEFSVEFLVERGYLHKVIMTLVAPVGLQELPQIEKAPYFSMMQSFDPELQIVDGEWTGYQGSSRGRTAGDPSCEQQGNLKPPASHSETVEEHVEELARSEKPGEIMHLKKETPAAIPYTCRNKNMVYGVHPTAISLNKEQEETLCAWIKKKHKQGTPATKITTRKKARKILGSKFFQATEGWLRRFTKRHPDIRKFIKAKEDRPEFDSDSEGGGRQQKRRYPGQVSRAQFFNLMREEGIEVAAEDLNRYFSVLDPSNTGYISQEALRKMSVEEEQEQN